MLFLYYVDLLTKGNRGILCFSQENHSHQDCGSFHGKPLSSSCSFSYFNESYWSITIEKWICQCPIRRTSLSKSHWVELRLSLPCSVNCAVRIDSFPAINDSEISLLGLSSGLKRFLGDFWLRRCVYCFVLMWWWLEIPTILSIILNSACCVHLCHIRRYFMCRVLIIRRLRWCGACVPPFSDIFRSCFLIAKTLPLPRCSWLNWYQELICCVHCIELR